LQSLPLPPSVSIWTIGSNPAASAGLAPVEVNVCASLVPLIKERCFLAAYDATTRELVDQMVAAGTSQPSYVEGIREGVRAWLGFWSERPDAARLCTLEVMAAGPEALAHREATQRLR
jgi:hypothetical protein